VEFRYTAMSLSAPELVQFRFRLEGLEGVAEEITSARVARYRRLSAGEYEFRVAARQEGGAWNEATARVTLTVTPRYWESRWFRLAALGLLVGAASGAGHWAGARRLRRRLAISEQKAALEQERSRISRDLHDDLGTGLTEITLLGAVANLPSSSPDRVKGCLGEIGDKSHELVRSLDEIVWAVNPKNDSLSNLVSYLCLFAQRLLERAAIQCRLDVPRDLPDRPLDARQRHALFLATKEALSNIAKHSAASEAWLRVTLTNSILTIALEDNGRGFDEVIRKPARNGLKNIDSRMRELGGRSSIRSVVGGGTRVELQLELGDAPPPRPRKKFWKPGRS
jgi:signal transduction histidine kinase